MQNFKDLYVEFCQSENDIPIFSKPWWLDATCGVDGWGVALVLSQDKVIASWPYMIKNKLIYSVLTQPNLTPKLGPYVKYPGNMRHEKKLSFDKKIFGELVSQLPSYHYFVQNFDPSFTNWLPLYWLGFSQQTMYTYRLEELADLDSIWKQFNNRVRTEIRKAERQIKVEFTEQVEEFYSVNKLTFDRQGLDIPYSLEYIKKIDAACKEKDCRKIFIAKDGSGNTHAAIYIVWDSKYAYYLMGGSDPKLRSSGSMNKLIWEAIKFSSERVGGFDFEGSMLQPVEKFVRSFGATQTPYFSISKINSSLLRFAKALKLLN